MLGNSFRRKVVLILLCSVLIAPWASAAGPRPQNGLHDSLDLFGKALSFLKSVWSAGDVPLIPDPPRPGSTPVPTQQLDDGDAGTGNAGPGRRLVATGEVMPVQDSPLP